MSLYLRETGHPLSTCLSNYHLIFEKNGKLNPQELNNKISEQCKGVLNNKKPNVRNNCFIIMYYHFRNAYNSNFSSQKALSYCS
jgi:hypothetical protein